MAKADMHIQKLVERRETLRSERAAIDARLDEIDKTIRLMRGEEAPLEDSEGPPQARQRPRTRSLKAIILGLLEDRREAGLTVNDCLEMAAQKGIELHRGSVSSLLSRFKRDEMATFDTVTGRYRLVQATLPMKPPAPATAPPAPFVVKPRPVITKVG
jgi:hypothetical protein